MDDNLFPSNPTHGMLFEQQNGVIYQYDASINSWIKLASDNINLKLVTVTDDGAMSSDDLKKLNRLILPAPQSTIIGNQCNAPFKYGTIDIRSGDNFIGVTGQAKLQNIDQYGEEIEKIYPFKIHQHTYGFDFTLDVQTLIAELETRGQIRLEGKRGVPGKKGERGDAGVNGILSGPPGDRGADGVAPECPLSIELEVIETQVKPGTVKALVDARVEPDPIDSRKYKLVFDRQAVGNDSASASRFLVSNTESTWVLATTVIQDDTVTPDPVNCGIPGERIVSNTKYDLYYLDIQPIMDAIYKKFTDEIIALKKGYETSVNEWLQKMSDLFDEQKRALCCALERCISVTKGNDLRQHMESVASAAVGRAKIVLNSRDSGQAVELSSTRLLKLLDHDDLCDNGAAFPENPAEEFRSGLLASSSAESPTITVDALLNSSITSAAKLELPPGDYIATIEDTTAMINNQYRANLRIRHIRDGKHTTTAFINKGSFPDQVEALSAYKGLSLHFTHEGGVVDFYLPSLNSKFSAGGVNISIAKSSDNKEVIKITDKPELVTQRPDNHCNVPVAFLKWYERMWNNGSCCGCVVNIANQDYIVVRSSIKPDESCGGKETMQSECMQRFTTNGIPPALAWPTFDGRSFVALPKVNATFMYSEDLNDLIKIKIANGEASNLKGDFGTVLFPAI